MKVAIFNVKYSANLGDGVIAECLEHALGKGTGWEIVGIDLAGRTRWAPPRRARWRARLLKLLKALPSPARDAIVSMVLGRHVRQVLAPAWRSALVDADFAVIGGGQLFQDGDLNFPLKLAGASGACEAQGVPFAVFAVGAGPQHSRQGAAMFKALLDCPLLQHVAVRDERSRERFGGLGVEAEIALDPGLLAASLWPAARRRSTPRHVGLGITHGSVLAYHASQGAVESGEGDGTVRRYGALVRQLLDDGHRVTCFTNGAGEDEEAMGELARLLGAEDVHGGRLRFQPRAETPRALARFIAQCDLVISHRLHASILAYAYAIPSIGLAWDDKVPAFYNLIEAPDRVLSLGEVPPAEVAALAGAALAEGVDEARHGVVLEMAEHGVGRLRSVIGETVAAARWKCDRAAVGMLDVGRQTTPAVS